MQRVVAHFRLTPGGPRRKQLQRQRAAVDEFVENNRLEVVKTFTDTTDDWPELGKAIAFCQTHGASLLLANVGERLVKSHRFTSRLVNTGIEFVAVDDPHFNSRTIGVLAAVAEDESERTSKRMKDALAAAKRRGVKLGSNRPGHWEGREHRRGFLQGSKKAAEMRAQRTRAYYSFVMPRILELRKEGWSLWAIAHKLNDEGFTTQRGKPYTDVAVMRVIRRYEQDTGEVLQKPNNRGRRRLRGAS